MWEDRLVEVFAPDGVIGAGLAISDLGVLTARHVVAGGLAGGVEVRIVRRGRDPSEPFRAEVVAEDSSWDLAVLRVNPDGARPGAWPIPRSAQPVGAMPGTSVQDCEAVGFPEASVQPAEAPGSSVYVRQTEQIKGRWEPSGDMNRPVTTGIELPMQWVPVDVDTAKPSSAVGWGGMSGAAVVLADQRLVGVVLYAEPRGKGKRLYAAPLGPAVRTS